LLHGAQTELKGHRSPWPKSRLRYHRPGSGRSVETGRSVLTSKADEYRTKTRECEERAKQTRDPFIKQQMLDIAQKWHTMAAYEDKYGR
jgi:hypothetical protein